MATTKRKSSARKKFIKQAIKVFEKLAVGLVKVWHENHSFVISKEDAINLTIDQLHEMVTEKNKTP